MEASGRNRIPGTVTEVKVEGLIAQINLRCGDNHIIALISSDAAQEMGIKVGDKAVALIKATSVMIIKAES